MRVSHHKNFGRAILLKKVYEPEDWERYWEERADLRGRCRGVLQNVNATKLSIIG